MKPKRLFSFKMHKYQEKILDAASDPNSKINVIYKSSSLGISELLLKAYKETLKSI